MSEITQGKNKDFKVPNEIPEGFFDIVSKVLNFVEEVDKTKNKLK